MNLSEKQNAYAAIKKRFNLRARERDCLDAHEKLDVILQMAANGSWDKVESALRRDGVITGPVQINIDGPNYGTINM